MEEDQILSWPAFFFLDNFSFYKFCLFMCRLVTKMNIGLRISWENKCSQRRRELRQVIKIKISKILFTLSYRCIQRINVGKNMYSDITKLKS